MRLSTHLYRKIHKFVAPVVLGLLLPSTSVCFAQTQGSGQSSEATARNNIREQLLNQATYSYSIADQQRTGSTNSIELARIEEILIDPRGQVLGCNGEVLEDYQGFRVGLFNIDPTDPTQSELGSPLNLTPTEVPDIVGNSIPEGISPNTRNINPYPLTNEANGEYSFLLNRNEGQLEPGRAYILVTDPPSDSRYHQRRIRLEILETQSLGGTDREQVRYRAVSLDGLPIGIEGETEVDQTVVIIEDGERVGLELLALQTVSTMCSPTQVEIVKTGDRANAAPGDIVLYRLSIRNISDVALDTLTVTDVLPLGFKFLEKGVTAGLNGQKVSLTATPRGQTITFSTDVALPSDQTLEIVYPAVLTPDAIRGEGINSASVTAERSDNNLEVRDGPALHRIRISPGILSDCGTILGRVFEDRNWDGEQQSGEPGIPHAVVIMDDGNKVTTDEKGLFSIKCVLPGHRTGALDLTVLPGYALAPNVKFIEQNSTSRLVRLAPGGLARMNFAVTPITAEEKKK